MTLAFQFVLPQVFKDGQNSKNYKSIGIWCAQSAILAKWLVIMLIVGYYHSWQPATVALRPVPLAAALRIGMEHYNPPA